MISEEIEHSIIKYLNKSADITDLDKLNIWIQDTENQVIFQNYVSVHYTVLFGNNTPDASAITEQLLKEIRNHKKSRYRIKAISVLKYAAIAILFIGIGYFFSQRTNHRDIIPTIPIKQNYITLESSDGTLDTITRNGDREISNNLGSIIARQKKNQLVYSEESKSESLIYNTLKVPYGKRFQVKLSDGTTVHLNSGSSLKYPVKFLSHQNRQVFLKGEAYFKVAKNKHQPFIVQADDLDIKVTGTQFNVSAYKEDINTGVVLVEGSVGLYQKNDSLKPEKITWLRPNYQANFDKTQKQIKLRKVNPKIYTSWINGMAVFRNATFGTIAKKLERLYNVTIINNNKALDRERFNASIDTENEPIEKVLSYFDKTYGLKYTLSDDKILISRSPN